MSGGRPRTGSTELRGKVRPWWQLTISTWRDGEPRDRWRGRCPEVPGVVLTEKIARDTARSLQEAYDAGKWNPYEQAASPPAAPAAETVEGYTTRWLEERTRKGLRSVNADESRLRTHLYPHLGTRPIVAVTRDELEAVRDWLDELVRDERMAWKTALNVWGIIRKLFSEAAGAKKRELRVRADDPGAGLQPPDRGREKAKAHLYPSEVAAVLSSPRIELRFRRLVALAVYSYARIGELAALTAGDVDLAHGVIDIHKAVDGKTGAVNAPKTPAGTRLVPIEPALRPLLEALCAEAGGGRLLAWVPAQREAAKMLRKALREAGVRREALFADDAQRTPVTFHDLRASGLTWCAVRGDEAMRIMQRAGHEDMATTMRYVREAENLRSMYGEVFAQLPPELCRSSATGVLPPPPSGGGIGEENPSKERSARGGIRTPTAGTIGADGRESARLRWGRWIPDAAGEGGSATGSATTVAVPASLVAHLAQSESSALAMLSWLGASGQPGGEA